MNMQKANIPYEYAKSKHSIRMFAFLIQRTVHGHVRYAKKSGNNACTCSIAACLIVSV